MRNLRIVFMGTPEFAAQTLQLLFEQDYCIVGVITAPDKPAGRGQKVQQSAVKKYAISKQLKVLQPTNLKNENFIETLRSLKANLQIVVAFRMLPRRVWEMPAYGTFNLHASLLPDYRGAAPINWAIINGERTTGVTTFFIDEHIDTGAIILQKAVRIDPEETAGELHDKLMNIGADLVVETVEHIKNNTVNLTTQQENKPLKTAYKIHKNTQRIDWTKDTDTIHNFIRGLSPYPTAWTLLYKNQEEIPIKIYRVTKEKTAHPYENGALLHDKKQLKIAVTGGFIHVEEMQLPGKRKMNSVAVINGFDFGTDPKVL
ncbi:MAG: methionyl-tRNA formyltransferase [Bacteroidota bacterium]